MNITFNGKEHSFDDVIYSWTIDNTVRKYIVSISFCGGLNEDGEENLYGSCLADICAQEVEHRRFYDTNDKNNGILRQVVDIISKDYDDIEYADGISGEYFTFKNESDFTSSIDDLNTVFGTLINVIRERENPIIPCIQEGCDFMKILED